MPTTFRPRHIDPCECGGGRVDTESNGLTVTYHCAACETFLAELTEGPEP